jgi:hypothetical protein
MPRRAPELRVMGTRVGARLGARKPVIRPALAKSQAPVCSKFRRYAVNSAVFGYLCEGRMDRRQVLIIHLVNI